MLPLIVFVATDEFSPPSVIFETGAPVLTFSLLLEGMKTLLLLEGMKTLSFAIFECFLAWTSKFKRL